jgi:hypothetical protein
MGLDRDGFHQLRPSGKDLPQTDVAAQGHDQREGLGFDEDGWSGPLVGPGRDQRPAATSRQRRFDRCGRHGRLVDQEDEGGVAGRDGDDAELEG